MKKNFFLKRSRQGESWTEKQWHTRLEHQLHDKTVMTNWRFYSNCILPRGRIFNWRQNSSSRSVAARMLAV